MGVEHGRALAEGEGEEGGRGVLTAARQGPSPVEVVSPPAVVIADDADHKRHGFRPLPNNYRVHVVGPANAHPDHTGEARTLIAAGVAPDEADALLHAALGFLRECQHAEDRAAGLPKRVFGLGSPAELGVRT